MFNFRKFLLLVLVVGCLLACSKSSGINGVYTFDADKVVKELQANYGDNKNDPMVGDQFISNMTQEFKTYRITIANNKNILFAFGKDADGKDKNISGTIKLVSKNETEEVYQAIPDDPSQAGPVPFRITKDSLVIAPSAERDSGPVAMNLYFTKQGK